MNKTINFMMFVLGVAVGSVVTWRYVEKKYEQIAQKKYSQREKPNLLRIQKSE